MSTGEKIRKKRLELGLTTKELAEKSGLTRQAVSHYENDRHDPGLLNAACIADVLGLSLDYLAGRKEA